MNCPLLLLYDRAPSPAGVASAATDRSVRAMPLPLPPVWFVKLKFPAPSVLSTWLAVPSVMLKSVKLKVSNSTADAPEFTLRYFPPAPEKLLGVSDSPANVLLPPPLPEAARVRVSPFLVTVTFVPAAIKS